MNFRDVNVDLGEPLENAAPDHLYNLFASPEAVFIEALDHVRNMMLRVRLSSVFEGRSGGGRRAPAVPWKAKLHMNGESHLEIDHRSPKSVVVGCRISLSRRKRINGDGFEPQIGTMLEFVDCIIDIGDRNHTHTDEPLR